MEELGEEGEGSSQPPQSVPQGGFCTQYSRCSEDAMLKGFEAVLTAWSGPRDAVLDLLYTSGYFCLKDVMGKLKSQGFARSPSRAVVHISLYLEKVPQGFLLQWADALI